MELKIDLMQRFQPAPEYIVLENPQVSVIENSSGLEGQCPLMQENFLSLWAEYTAESSQVIGLLDQARSSAPDVKANLLPRIQEIQMKLKKTISELNRLARPEWNRESLRVLVRWALPQSTLFNIEVDPNIRDGFIKKSQADFLTSRGLHVKPGLTHLAAQALVDYKKKAHFAGLNYRITEAQYMGEGSAALLPFFMVQSFFFQDLMEKNISFDYDKPMTWLEYCQFTQTAEFSVDVKLTLKNFGGAVVEKNQKFILRSL